MLIKMMKFEENDCRHETNTIKITNILTKLKYG